MAPASSGTRGWLAALDARTGNELWRWYAMPRPGEPGSETWKDKTNAWKTGGGGLWQTGSYDPATKLTIWGTGNPVPDYDPMARPGDNLYTNSAVALDIDTGKLAWHFQYTPNDSWDYDEVGIHMLLRRHDQRRDPQGRRAFRAQRLLLFARSRQRQLHQGRPVCERAELDQGLDPKTGKPVEYDPRLDVQKYVPEARALRGDGMKRTCPTWHGGVAYQPTAYNPVKKIAYGVGTEGCFAANGMTAAFKGPDGGLDRAKFSRRTYTSDLYYGSVTAYDAINHKVLAKAVTDIEIRSGALVTAGGAGLHRAAGRLGGRL